MSPRVKITPEAISVIDQFRLKHVCLMFLIKTILFLLLFASCPLLIPAQNPFNFGKCPVEYGYQGSYHFAQESRSRVTIRKVKEIPTTVLNNIDEHLKARVGKLFFKRLKFDYGYAEDFDDASPMRTADEERIDGYDLFFRFSDPVRGLKAFHFKVVTDGKGTLLSQLELPDISSDPQRANFIPCKQALEIAERNAFPRERSSILFRYDFDSQTFVWDIYDRKTVPPDDPILGLVDQGTYRHILLDASTGIVLRIFKETIVL